MKAAFSFLPLGVSASPSSPPLPSSPPSPSLFASQPQCQRCLGATATVYCPSCPLLFCLSCADAVHNCDVVLLQHKLRFHYAPSSPLASPAAAAAAQLVQTMRPPAFPSALNAKRNFSATAPHLVSYHSSSPNSESRRVSPSPSSLPSSLPPPVPAQPPAVPPRPLKAFMLHRPRGASLSSAAPLAAGLQAAQAAGSEEAAGCPLSLFSDGEADHRRRVQTLLQRVGEEDPHYATDAECSPLSPATPLSARAHSASVSASLQHRSHSVSQNTTSHSAAAARMEGAALRPHSHSVSEGRVGRLHSHSLSESNPLSAVSPSRRLLAFASSPEADGPSSSTFKLAAYSLSSSASSSSPPAPVLPPPFTLSISPLHQTLTVTSQDGLLQHCRSFSSLSSVTQSERGNPACFTLCFNDSRPTAQCLSPSPSEAALISSLLLSFIEQLRSASASSPPAAPPVSLLYAGRVQKRSRMRWKSLHMVVRPFHLLLYTQRQQETEGAGGGGGGGGGGEELHRSISLQGCAVRSGLAGEGKAAAAGLGGDDRERCWTLEQRGGKATLFRCLSAAERETVVAMISKAMDRAAAGGKDPQDDEEQKTREEDSSREDKEIHGQLLSVNNSTQLSSTTALLSSHPASAPASASHELPEANPLSPLVSPSLPSASAGSPVPALTSSISPGAAPHRSVSHARQLQLAKASRRRSRRSMSKDFRQLREREALPNISVAQPASSSSSHLLLSPSSSPLSPISDFAELPPDPRPPPSISPVLSSGVYSLLSSLLSSLMSGCHLTASLYVPRAVWWQTGRKVAAFGVKVDCMEAVWEEVAAVLVPAAAEADGGAAEQQLREGEEALERVLAVMQQAQHRLSQSLPYIAQVKDRRRDAAASVGSSAGSALSSGSAKPIAALSRLLTRATDAASLSTRKLDEADTARYCQAVQQMLEGAAVFQRWHGFAAATRERRIAACSLLLQHLHCIDCWLYCVLAQLLLRDLGDAIRRYVKHQYRGLTLSRSAGGGAAGGGWSRGARQPFSSSTQTERRGHWD